MSFYYLKNISLKILAEFQDFTFIFILLTVIILIIAIISITLFKLISSRAKSTHTYTLCSKYYYIIDLKHQKVKRLNGVILGNERSDDFTSFLNSFHEYDRDNFKNWLRDILNEEGEFDRYEENKVRVFILLNKRLKKTRLKSVFSIEAVDKINEIVYLKSIRLYNLPCVLSKNKKKFKNTIYSLGEVKKSYEDGMFARGSFFVIQFKKRDNVSSYYNDFEIKYLLLDAIIPILKPLSTYAFFKNDCTYELNILYKEYLAAYDLKKITSKIYDAAKKCFENYGFDDVFKISISSALVSKLFHDYDLSYSALKELTEKNLLDNNKTAIYRKEEKATSKNSRVNKNELLRIIKENKIQPLYRQIFIFKNNEVLNYGYEVNFKVLSNRYTSLEELKVDAKAFNNTSEILSLCIRNAVSQYISLRDNFYSKIVFKITFSELSKLAKNFPRINKVSEIHFVFLLDINEFLDLEEEDISDVVKLFHESQVKGFEIAVLCSPGDYQIPLNLGNSVDLFFVDLKLEENVKADSKSFINAHYFLDALVSFKKNIIEINAKSLNEVELLYRSGLNYFSTDVIQPYNEMITPLDKKVIKRLTNTVIND